MTDEQAQRIKRGFERLHEEKSAASTGTAQSTGSVSNRENARQTARRWADNDYKFDNQKRRVGLEGSAFQTWYDQRWSEIVKQNKKAE